MRDRDVQKGGCTWYGKWRAYRRLGDPLAVLVLLTGFLEEAPLLAGEAREPIAGDLLEQLIDLELHLAVLGDRSLGLVKLDAERGLFGDSNHQFVQL